MKHGCLFLVTKHGVRTGEFEANLGLQIHWKGRE